MFVFPEEILRNLLLFFHPFRSGTEVKKVLSNRRNKGLLFIKQDDEQLVRDINLEFFNSGTNDGLPSALIRECILLKGILSSHPHIVPIESISFPSINIVRLVYPFQSETLRDVMLSYQDDSKIPTSLVREISHQIFRGVAFIHAKNIVHRNIRPDNIMIIRGDVVTVKLSDFGFSTFSDFSPSLEDIRNRPLTDKEEKRLLYRSPETLVRSSQSSQSPSLDIWSLGVVLLEMCLHPSPLPWSGSQSESECFLRILENFGTPDSWPESDQIGFWQHSLPKFKNQKKLMVVGGDHGDSSSELISRMLKIDPRERITIKDCLASSFALGLDESPSRLSSEDSKSSILVDRWIHSSSKTLLNRVDWIGGYMFKLARIIDCPSWKPIHLALMIFDSIYEDSHDVAVALAACLKFSNRIYTSRDAYKQVNCLDIVSACNNSFTENDIITYELYILSHVEIVADRIGTTTIDWVSKLASSEVVSIASYLGDLCLFEPSVSQEFSPMIQAVSCSIIAADWIGVTDDKIFSEGTVLNSISIETVQLCLSRISAKIITEKRAELYNYENGLLMRIIELPYIANGKSLIPTNSVNLLRSTRSAIESLVRTLQPPSDVPRVPSTPSMQLQTSTPRPLLRSSTIHHANQWAIESRRRSRVSLVSSTKKRSRSATPAPHPEIKRHCLDAKKFSSVGDIENLEPNLSTPSSSKVLLTTRRSARLARNRFKIP